MKKVLYISNISVPYRTAFFEKLGKVCNLTVLYERRKSANRNDSWENIRSKNYTIKYLDGRNIMDENGFSFKILKQLDRSYDCIIFGCYNSPVEIFAMLYMRLTHRKYALNIDGEIFEPHNKIKRWGRNFVLRGAALYLSASSYAIPYICRVTHCENVIPYYFSSLSKEEIEQAVQSTAQRNDNILVVGQYEAYKGLDILLDVAKTLPDYTFHIVGMSKKHIAFEKLVHEKGVANVNVTPFLSKEELVNEYRTSKMIVLPSRQECWGLVINEAAAYGTPIVSTIGSGAAVEFLRGKYSQFLARSDDVVDLSTKIKSLAQSNDIDIARYSEYLKRKSLDYSIEHMVEAHIDAIQSW